MPNNDRWSQADVLETFKKPNYASLEVVHGMTLTHTGSQTTGQVVGYSHRDTVILRDRFGATHSFPAHDGAFLHKGTRVALHPPTTPRNTAPTFTASGSVALGNSRAKVARASRIWVEGIHDAELIEKVWGDDLREEAIVVEPLHGADDLQRAIDDFAPGARRRLGVLLDHLVPGSKESRLAAAVDHDAVLILGHPFVDIWAAIAPAVVGLAEWPTVAPGKPWKKGVLDELGVTDTTGAFWGRVLDSVTTYKDLATPLVNSVEQLIDFVTAE